MQKSNKSEIGKKSADAMQKNLPSPSKGVVIRHGRQDSYYITPNSDLKHINRQWHLVDATGLVLGRMASEIAKILRGKHKPAFTPSADMGDYVIVINAEKIALTGKKWQDKVFYWHTGYPGGVKSITPLGQLRGQFAERLVGRAVERMLRRTPMGRKQISHLFVYQGASHPHAGQKPITLDLAGRNVKNHKPNAISKLLQQKNSANNSNQTPINPQS